MKTKKNLLENLFIIFHTTGIFEKTIGNIDFDILSLPLLWEAHTKNQLNYVFFCKKGGGQGGFAKIHC